jgi:glycine dehydrogenase subunit 2
MLTNPSTLGLFEARIEALLEAVHAAGALAYMDGANMNAVLGKFKPGQAGFDVMHFNTHKTFSTPHGGGGPGAGPVAVNEALLPFLPGPRVLRDADGTLPPRAAGRAAAVDRPGALVPGQHVGVLVRAYAYLLAHGGSGLARSARTPCWPPTTCGSRVGEAYELPYPQHCKHEFVASARGSRHEPACACSTSPSG